MSNTSSATDLALSTAQVVPLAMYTVIGLLLGLLGNSLVLYSSVRYNTIKLDQVTLLFVQNLAAADLLYILFNVLPVSVTFIARKYIMGDVYCFISAQLAFIPGTLNGLTILALTAYRLHLVRCPFNSMSILTAKFVLFILFLISLILTCICLWYKSKSVFIPHVGKCVSTVYINIEASVVFRITVCIIIVVPIVAITIINGILCVISVRSSRKAQSERSNMRPLVTVCFLSGMFIISWVPYLCYAIWQGVDSSVPLQVVHLAYACIQINSFCNPILYTVTNKRFGKYVRNVARGMLPCVPGVKIQQRVKTSTTGVSSRDREKESKA